jgi:hypothetical protein
MTRTHPHPFPQLDVIQNGIIGQFFEETMTAKMRSRITERQEKGVGPISFKRLLVAGGVGAMSAMLLSRMLGFFPGCAGAIGLTIAVIVLTHPIEGLALHTFLLYSIRSRAAIAALHAADNDLEPGPLSQILKASPDDGRLDADVLYEVEWEDEGDDLPPQTLVYKGGFGSLDKAGLAVVDNPFFRGNGSSNK